MLLQSHSAAAASSRFPLRTQAEQLPGSGETAAAIPIPSGSMRASLIQALDYLRGLESRVPHFPYLILFSDPGVFISNSIPLLKVVSLAPFPPKKKSLKKIIGSCSDNRVASLRAAASSGEGGYPEGRRGGGARPASSAPHPPTTHSRGRPGRTGKIPEPRIYPPSSAGGDWQMGTPVIQPYSRNSRHGSVWLLFLHKPL